MKKYFIIYFILLNYTFISSVINFAGATSSLILSGTSAKLILNKPMNNVLGVIQVTDKQENSIIEAGNNCSIYFKESGKLIYENNSTTPQQGSYSPSAGLFLKGQESFNFERKVIDESVFVSGVDNLIFGSPVFNKPIILQDCNTTLTLSINSKMCSDIVMNGASLYLQNDLILKDECHITGSGTVYFNGYSLVYPVYKTPITSDLTMVNANDITVNGRTLQTTNTSFTGTSNVFGKGVILDFTGGGSYTFASNSITYISGLHIKGLGSYNGGNLILGSGAKVYFTGCILELGGPYTQTDGEVIFEGGMCKVISSSWSSYTVSGANTKMTVDRQRLFYENVAQFAYYPFATWSGGTINLINDATIASNITTGSTYSSIKVYGSNNSGYVNATHSDINLTYGETITFFNENPNSPKTMTFGGGYNTINFPETTPSIIVQPNITLTIRNVTFENFNPAHFSLMGSGGTLAKLVFADNVILNIRKDLSLATGELPLTGTTIINGNSNSTLTLASQSITFTGDSKLLTIKGLKLKYSAFDSLKCNSSTSTVAIQSSEVYMTNTGITIDTGYIQIKDYVKIRGTSETLAEATIPLNFSSKALLTITSGATLDMGMDTGFYYLPDISQDFGTASIQKRHLVMADKSSTLILKKATLNTGPKGLALDRGKVVISDNVTCNTSFTSGCEFELGSNVNFTLLNGSNFNVNGAMKYVSST
jgi:hypothetical protein